MINISIFIFGFFLNNDFSAAPGPGVYKLNVLSKFQFLDNNFFINRAERLPKIIRSALSENEEKFYADGSIERDGIINGEWVDQEAEHPQYRFSVMVQTVDDRADFIIPVAIKVIDRETDKQVQIIYKIDKNPTHVSAEKLISLVDANFDGLLDIQMPEFSGGVGPNYSQNFFLFDRTKKRFEFDEELSSLPQITIDEKNKLIESFSRNSCCIRRSEIYRYMQGKLTLIEIHERTLEAEDYVTITTGKLVNGKMKYRVTREKMEDY